MKTTRTSLTALLLVASASVAYAGDNTVMVGLDIGVEASLAQWVDAHGGTVTRCYGGGELCLVELPADVALDGLVALDGVRYAERDTLVPLPEPVPVPRLDVDGTDDCAPLWELSATRVLDVWPDYDGTDAPYIAVQDGGFLQDHEEIVGRISGQYDYGDGDPIAEMNFAVGVPAHGTFIAAMLVGDPDNDAGRAGVVPNGMINAQKIADSGGAFYISYAVDAMYDLADGDLNVRVLNYSIASSSYSSSMYDAIGALNDAGILMVAAAANCSVIPSLCYNRNNDDYPSYPSSYDHENIVSVAGTLQDGSLNGYSHVGPTTVDIAAPGVSLCSAGANGVDDYYTSAGTSYATPIVAGIAALLFEAHPDLSPTEAARVLRASSDRSTGIDDEIRSGIVDARAAIDTAVPRFVSIGDRVVDGETIDSWTIGNVGADGEACLVVTHDPSVEYTSARDTTTGTCWERRVYNAGDILELPDAGGDAATDHLTTFCGPIAAHEQAVLEFTLRGRSSRSSTAQARVVMSSEGAAYLNAPYRAGEDDATGFLAWSFNIDVVGTTEAAGDPCDAGDDTGVTDTGVADTGVTDTGVTDTGVTDTGVADTGVTDTGVTDTGVADTGVTDTGVADTGVADTGVADSGSEDTDQPDTTVDDTSEADAATTYDTTDDEDTIVIDAAEDATADIASEDGGRPIPSTTAGPEGGCATATPRAPSTGWLALMAGIVVWRRRRGA